MKTEYQYINFKLHRMLKKTGEWGCVNNKSGAVLGIVKWYPVWRQYCYFPSVAAVYSKGCLEDINNFIQQLIDERQKEKAKAGEG